MPKLIDLTGQKFGKLTVEKQGTPLEPSGLMQWWCLCDCGNKTIVAGAFLRNENTVSCGCAKKERDEEYRKKHFGMKFNKNF